MLYYIAIIAYWVFLVVMIAMFVQSFRKFPKPPNK
jgi:hypothetical protein